jgi:hypothetical protein
MIFNNLQLKKAKQMQIYVVSVVTRLWRNKEVKVEEEIHSKYSYSTPQIAG